MKRIIVAQSGLAAAFGAVAVVCLAAAAARAAVPTPVAFDLHVSPYARVLDAIGESFFDEVLMEESCDNPHLRVRNRNKPAFMLANDSDSAAPITSFSLQINEGPYLFGTGDFATDGFTQYVKSTIYSDPGVAITGSSLSPDGKTVTINFSGLEPGKKAIFNVDIDADDMEMFPYPDYRCVLFGAPMSNGGTTTDPATYSATFTSSTPAPNTRVLSGNFAQVTQAPTWMNDIIRPYRVMDTVEVTHVNGMIPEPSGAGLALAGVVALAACRRRR